MCVYICIYIYIYIYIYIITYIHIYPYEDPKGTNTKVTSAKGSIKYKIYGKQYDACGIQYRI